MACNIYIYDYVFIDVFRFFCSKSTPAYRKSIHSCSPAGSASTGETQGFQLLLGGQPMDIRIVLYYYIIRIPYCIYMYNYIYIYITMVMRIIV